MDKREIREKIKKLRAVMDPEQIKAFSGVIADKLLSLERVIKAGRIMAFYSYNNEPQMLGFINKCIDMGKSISLPCVIGKGEMIAADYSRDCVLKENVYGIPEPAAPEGYACKPGVIIVPGIAFGLDLGRIGQGGGYYDRFLKGTKAYKIGVCFDFQIVEKIDAGSHDIPMDLVVTEKRIIGEI